MKNVLHELYNGHLSRDSMTFEKGTPYARALDSMVDAESDLLASLSEEQKKAFQLYSKALDDFYEIIRREEFAAGFQIGARIMMAVLDEAPAMIHPDLTD